MTGKGTALIVGGSRGIGAAIASRLAQDDYDVAMTYASRKDSADALVSALNNRGGRAIAIKADGADPAAIRSTP